ncbi:MAG: CotH kinase family protein [Flavobacteriales bacterium]|nr:CotH kinase family protein [Flavobacteriales bacterium]
MDDNNGNLFKAGDNFGGGPGGSGNAADMAYYGADQNSYSTKYDLKTNETENDWSDLLALLDLLNNSNAADLQAQYPQKWEWNPMLRSLALDNMFSNLDSYVNSARNYYLYHDSTTFKWNWIKWDANEAFGSYSGQGVGNLLNLAPNYVASGRPHLTKIFNDGVLYHDYEMQYCAALENFNNSYLDPKIDAIKALIQDHVTADPNKQYTTAQFTLNIESNITTGGGPGGGTIYGLKSFIGSRSSYLNGVIDCNTVGIDEFNDEELLVYPNPTSGSVSIRSTIPLSVSNVQLFDMLGRSLSFSMSANVIDLSTYASGTYVLRVLENGRMRQIRIMKQ